MNNIKDVIQKEEYISLAINKYIAQTATIPKLSDKSLDWEKLETAEYLGVNFNKLNPITSKNIKVTFDNKNSAYIQGVIEDQKDYNSEYNYLYNFYINKVFRVNTIPPSNITKEKLVIGSQVLYNDIQKQIVSILNETNHKDIKQSNQQCTTDNYFYQLNNGKLTYKYCRSTYSFDVYQDAPIYLENWDDLQFVKANIGDKAFVKKNNSWYEYYYQGDVDTQNWVPSGMGDALTQNDSELSIADRILSYIPDSKDLVLRINGGCMLANGDIFCWGDNKYKKAGIENYGQMDTNLKPDYVNTPVMLKVQIENIESQDLISKKWYNNPYRVKFEKVAMNNKNVCGISPIFDYYEAGTTKKYGGDLYCNGSVNSDSFYLDTNGQTETSILRKNKVVAAGKENGIYNSNAIYLKDIVMVDGTWAALSDSGKIYTVGSNEKGALGIGNDNYTLSVSEPTVINTNGQVFKKIYALRDIKCFGALDEQNYFWIWGERPNGTIYNKPIILSNSKKFNENGIFVNSKEFVLKSVDNRYFRTYSDLSIKDLGIDGSALSASIYDYGTKEILIYIDKNMQLQASSEFLNCKDKDFNSCSSSENAVFTSAMNELNSLTNTINNNLYANFSNISIFGSTINQTVADYGEDYVENFENSSTSGWNVSYIHDGGLTASKFLGMLGRNRIATDDGSEVVKKTFSLGSSWANQNVKITFDMYEIGSWDGDDSVWRGPNGLPEKFYVYINNNLVQSDMYSGNNVYDTKAGVDLGIISNTGNQTGQKHSYTFSTTLDSNGKSTLGFGAVLGEDYTNESFGIDNIRISRQIDNATFSSGTYFENFENSNHDYWIVPKGPVPYTSTSDPFYNYPIYTDSGTATKFLGRFNRKSWGLSNYQGESDGSEEVYKVFSFGSEYANKEVTIEYDFYRIDDWRYNIWYTIDRFYTFINGTKYLTYSMDDNVSSSKLNKIDNTGNTEDRKFHFTRTENLDEFGNIKLGFGAYIKDANIDSVSWGVDNILFTLTGNKSSSSAGSSSNGSNTRTVPYICSMTGLGSSSQMYCWGNVGRSIPILSTSLYDVAKISTINKLFISQESEKNVQMAFDEYNNNGSLFLEYPTYIGGFDYPFYFK